MKTTPHLKNYGNHIFSRCVTAVLYDCDYTAARWRDPLFETHLKIDLKNKTAKELLYTISRTYKYMEYGTARRRFYKKLCQIVQDVKMTEEYVLASSFCNIMVDREQVTTEIKDGKELKECAIKNPYDIDYRISSNNIATVLKDWVAKPSKKKKKTKKEIFSVVTKNSNGKIPPCPHCKGEGVLRCEHCNGSGREQYVDGYYANGEERIKTGNCPHCYGRGNTQCEACGGEGKPQIYADNYQIVKSVEDKYTILRYDCISGVSNIWEKFEDAYSADIGSDIGEYEDGTKYRRVNHKNGWRGYENIDEDGIKALEISRFILQDDDNLWCECDDDELEQCIDKLYKNQNEIIIDHDGQPVLAMLEEKGQEYTELYQKNKDAAYGKWEEMGLLKGQVGCALEYHALVPIIKINCINKRTKEKITIFIFEFYHDEINEDIIAHRIEGSKELGFWDGLFL